MAGQGRQKTEYSSKKKNRLITKARKFENTKERILGIKSFEETLLMSNGKIQIRKKNISKTINKSRCEFVHYLFNNL